MQPNYLHTREPAETTPRVDIASSPPGGAAPQAPERKTQRQTLYELLRQAQPGELLDWERLGAAIGIDGSQCKERARISVPLRNAIRDLEDNDHRSAANERGHGYRILSQEQRLDLAHQHQHRATTEIEHARRHVDGVDLSAMDPNTRRAFQITALALTEQQQTMQRFDIRQKQLEYSLDLMRNQQVTTGQTVDEMAQRLAALEQHINGTPNGGG